MKFNTQNFKLTTKFAAMLFATGVLYSSPIAVGVSHADCSATAEPGVDWQGCRKRNLVMSGSDFTGSNLSKADMSSSDLRNSKFDETNFRKAVLVRASLEDSSAMSAQFSGIIAYRTDFSAGNYNGANFEKAEIIRAKFNNAQLENVNMSKGEISRVSFSGAQISFVSFDYSNLARSDFRDSKLSGPISMKGSFLFRTRLEGVDLSNVSDLAQWQLELACGNGDTKLPDGLNAPANWPCDEESD